MSSREEDFACELSVDAAPYVLGALEDEEGYREHLAGCARCRSEVAEMQFVADNLPATVPVALALLIVEIGLLRGRRRTQAGDGRSVSGRYGQSMPEDAIPPPTT